MSGYLGSGGGGGGVLPGDLYQDWAIVTVGGPDWTVSTPNSWISATGLTYTVNAKSNSFSYGSPSSLVFPVSGFWRIHIRPGIINYSSDLFYGLMVNSLPLSFGVAAGGSSQRQGNDTVIHSATAGHTITPAIYLLNGSATWQFTSGFQIYFELLKPAV